MLLYVVWLDSLRLYPRRCLIFSDQLPLCRATAEGDN